MKNEWKELKIDNLPEDYLTGEYEFELRQGCDLWSKVHDNSTQGRLGLLVKLEECLVYRYRKIKPPTHEEILKPRYWKCDDGVWRRVIAFNPKGYSSKGAYVLTIDGEATAVTPGWFIGRKSADIPPEGS